MIRAGKLKGLAITTKQRSPLAPDIPTVAESGRAGLRRHHLARPRRARQDAGRRSIARLDTELRAVLAEPDVDRQAGRDRRASRRPRRDRPACARCSPRTSRAGRHPRRRKDQAAMSFHELVQSRAPADPAGRVRRAQRAADQARRLQGLFHRRTSRPSARAGDCPTSASSRSAKSPPPSPTSWRRATCRSWWTATTAMAT